jgi:fructose-specific phosphotransferase system component IIB
MDLVLYGVAHTYLGVQEVNRNAQEEDKYEQGEQLVRRVSE